MNKFFAILKLFLNIILFCIYSFFAIIIWDWIFWAILTYVSNVPVPWSWDPSHLKVAIFSVFCIFLITILFRKFFYLEVFSDKLFDENKKYKTKKEKMEIYVNKEIK